MSSENHSSETMLLGRPPEDFDKQGIAGNMARSFIRSPLTPLLLILSLFVGIIGLIMTPRQEDPQISVPLVDLMVSYPGAGSSQVNSLVAQPLERLLHEIDGVDHVYSVSRHGQALVTVQFNVGEQMENSLVKVYNKLSSNRDLVPPGAMEPIIKPKGADDVPVVTFTLWSDEVSGHELRLLGLDVLQALSVDPDVAQGFVVGGESRQVKVEMYPERLASYGVTPEQLGHTIQAANAEKDLGKIEAWNKSFQIYTGAFLQSAQDVESLMVAVHDGAPVYVRDVARVIEDSQDVVSRVNFYTGSAHNAPDLAKDGVQAITVAIAKKHGTNGVSVATNAINKLTHLQGYLIPDNVKVSISRDYGKSANAKVNELIFKLFIATGAVTLLIWFFLGWRAATVVAIVIPVVILVTVFIAWLGNYTIDRVSLFALIFSIGILVDDAVVVLENIYRRWLIDGQTGDEVCIDATAEVGNPTIVATLAVIAALMPMAFVTGMMGPYMEPIPSLGSAAMAFSLFAAFAFTPWLAVRIKPTIQQLQKDAVKEHEQSERIERFFRRLLNGLLENKMRGRLFLVGIVSAFFLSVLLIATTSVTVKLLPFDNKSDLAVVINFPEGTAMPVTAGLTNRLAQALHDVPEVVSMESYVGTAAPFDFNGLVRHYYLRSEPWQADIQIHLQDKKARHRSSHEIAEAVREQLTAIATDAGARIQIIESPPGPPVLQAVVAEVYGPDAETRLQVAKDLTDIFRKSDNVTDVDNFIQENFAIWRFEIDVSKAVRRGISIDVINRTLEMAMGSYRVGDAKQGMLHEPVYIVIQVPYYMRTEFSRLGQIPVPSQMGGTVPLGEIGRFVRDVEQSVIYHKDLQPVEYVIGNTTGRLGAPIYGMLQIEDLLEGYHAPDSVKVQSYYTGVPDDTTKSSFEWAGEWTVTYETFRDMGLAFGVALVLIYMLVVWEFRNFTVPAIVMAPIPLTLIGIVPGHWLMGAEFTATSMIGFIALAGIIVRNSLLLVDFARQEIAKGVPIVDAVIFSCQARTRPILITGAALVLGSSVILFDPIFQGMAVSLMFGVVVSTVLTLVVIPLGCVSVRTSMTGEDGSLPCMVMPQAECSDVVTPHLPSQPSANANINNLVTVSAPQVADHTLLSNVPSVSSSISNNEVIVPVALEIGVDEKGKESNNGVLTHGEPSAPLTKPSPEIENTSESVSTTSDSISNSFVANAKQDSLDSPTKSSESVVETTQNHESSFAGVGANHAKKVSSEVLQTEPVSPVMQREVADAPLSKPVTKSSRPPRKKKEEVAMNMIETPEPTVAEKRALSKRPRRGIRIKGAENT